MSKREGPWGSYLGKIIAAFLVLAFVFGAAALCMHYEKHRSLLVDTADIDSAEYSLDGSYVVMKFKLNGKTQKGYSFSGFETYREDGQLVLKLYSSVTESEEYKRDENDFYTIYVPYTIEDKTLAQEGEDGIVSSLYDIKK